jgi:hypothetical protein
LPPGPAKEACGIEIVTKIAAHEEAKEPLLSRNLRRLRFLLWKKVLILSDFMTLGDRVEFEKRGKICSNAYKVQINMISLIQSETK